MEENLVDYLSESAVNALVGARIYPVHAPQGAALPYIVYSMSGFETFNNHDDTGDTVNTSIDCECYAATYSSCFDLAETLRVVLDGKSLDFGNLLLAIEKETFLPPTDGSDNGTYLITQTFDVLHQITETNL